MNSSWLHGEETHGSRQEGQKSGQPGSGVKRARLAACSANSAFDCKKGGFLYAVALLRSPQVAREALAAAGEAQPAVAVPAEGGYQVRLVSQGSSGSLCGVHALTTTKANCTGGG